MKHLLKLFFLACVASLLAAGCSTSGRVARQSGWTVLFDGKSTEAFRGFKRDSLPVKGWVIEDGALKSLPAEQVDLITREQYEDFELELEWKVEPAANSGIMFHVSEAEPETYMTGPEMQIVDDANTSDGLDPKTSAGSLYALVAPASKKCHPAGEWNHIRLLVQGHRVEHWMNGAKLLEYDLGSETLNTLIAHSKFKDWPRFAREKTGYIAIQNHGGSVWFRNIRVRRL
jgi:hypothetical protein